MKLNIETKIYTKEQSLFFQKLNRCQKDPLVWLTSLTDVAVLTLWGRLWSTVSDTDSKLIEAQIRKSRVLTDTKNSQKNIIVSMLDALRLPLSGDLRKVLLKFTNSPIYREFESLNGEVDMVTHSNLLWARITLLCLLNLNLERFPSKYAYCIEFFIISLIYVSLPDKHDASFSNWLNQTILKLPLQNENKGVDFFYSTPSLVDDNDDQMESKTSREWQIHADNFVKSISPTESKAAKQLTLDINKITLKRTDSDKFFSRCESLLSNGPYNHLNNPLSSEKKMLPNNTPDYSVPMHEDQNYLSENYLSSSNMNVNRGTFLNEEEIDNTIESFLVLTSEDLRVNQNLSFSPPESLCNENKNIHLRAMGSPATNNSAFSSLSSNSGQNKGNLSKKYYQKSLGNKENTIRALQNLSPLSSYNRFSSLYEKQKDCYWLSDDGEILLGLNDLNEKSKFLPRNEQEPTMSNIINQQNQEVKSYSDPITKCNNDALTSTIQFRSPTKGTPACWMVKDTEAETAIMNMKQTSNGMIRNFEDEKEFDSCVPLVVSRPQRVVETDQENFTRQATPKKSNEEEENIMEEMLICLESGARTTKEIRKVLQSTVDWSTDLLSPKETGLSLRTDLDEELA